MTRKLLLSLLAIVGAAFIFAITFQDVSVFNFRRNHCPDLDNDEVKLKTALERAAMADKTVIMTTVNDAWMAPGSVLDLFLEGFWTGERTSGLLKHLIIVAVDEKAYEKCRLKHVHCLALKTEGVDFSGDQKIMMENYRKLMWSRIKFLRSVLELGYNFIFTDVDVIWFRDPTPFFSTRNYDFQTACDYYHGNPDDTFNTANGGFNFVRSNNRTQLFYKYWYEARLRHPGLHDQDVLNLIKTEPYRYEIGLIWKMLPTDKFGGLCQPSKDFKQVYTMHVNCCIGLENKLNDLRLIMEDWRVYKALPESLKSNHTNKWSVPKRC